MKRNILAIAIALAVSLPAVSGEPPVGYEFITDPAFLRFDAQYVERMQELVARTPDEHRSEVILRLLDSRLGSRYVTDSGMEPDPEGCIRRFSPLMQGDAFSNSFVKRLVRMRLAGCYVHLLQVEQARHILAPLAHIRNWYGIRVATGGAAIAVETAVDRNPSLEEEYRLGWRRGTWQPMDTGSPWPAIQMDRLAGLEGDILYLQAQFRTREDFKGYLLFEEDGSGFQRSGFLVRVDGLEIARTDPEQKHIPGNLYIPVTLRSGWHRIVVKVLASRISFSCSLVEQDGSPYVVEEETGRVMHETAGAASADLSRPKDAWAYYSRLSGEAKVSRAEGGMVSLTRALLALADGNNEEAYYSAGKGVELLPQFAPSHFILAVSNASYEGLPESDRRNHSTQLFRKVLELEPDAVAARLMLAANYAGEDKLPEAFELVEEGLERTPASLALHLGRLDLVSETERRIRRPGGYSGRGGGDSSQITLGEKYWFDIALEEIKAVEALAPDTRAAVRARTEYLEKRNLPARAKEVVEAYAQRHQRVPALRNLASAYKSIGELEQAVRIRRRLEDAGAEGYPRPGRSLTSLYFEAQQYREAAQRMEESLPQFPFDARLRKQLGQAYSLLGERQKAVEAFREALSLDPSDTDLQRCLRDMHQEEPFYRKYQLDIEEHASLDEITAEHTESDVARLIDQMVVRLHEDGTAEFYLHEAMMVLTPKGVEKVKDQRLPGDEVLEIRTILPDGRVFEPNLRVSPGSATMPKLEPGAVVEYRVTGTKRTWGGTGRFDLDAWFFQDPAFSEPFLLSEYVLEAHKDLGRRLDIHKGQFRKMSDPEPGARDDYIVYRWTARDMPRIKGEPLAPHASRLLPMVHVRSRGSWEHVSADLASDRSNIDIRPTRLIRRKAKEVLAEAGLDAGASIRSKVDALHQFVCSEIKTSGNESNAEAVLRAGSGDRTRLFTALLEAVGIEVYPAMMVAPEPVLARSQEPFDWFSPRRLWYGASVVLLEDGTPYRINISGQSGRYHPPGVFSDEFRDGLCLVSVDGNGCLTPLTAFSRGLYLRDARIMLSVEADGSVEGEFTITFEPSSEVTSRLKYGFEEMEESVRKVRVQNIVASMFRGGEMQEDWSATGFEPKDPFILSVGFKSAHLFARTAKGLSLKGAALSPLNLVRSLIGSTERELPMVFPVNASERATVLINFDPQKLRLSQRPVGRSFTLPFATYNLNVEESAPGVIQVERSYVFRHSIIAPEEYQDLVHFCRKVDALEEQVLLLSPVGE